MAPSLIDSGRRLHERVVDLLWRQWAAIGAAGSARPGDDRLIDPEALILATTRFGRRDPRLMDESLDWLVQFGRRINVQRLQALHREWPGVADGRVLAALSDLLGRQSVLRKWRDLGSSQPPDASAEALFTSTTGGGLPVFGTPDPVFQKRGLLREAMEHRSMSQPPGHRSKSNLIFALRALFGVNARAEIMAWLLTHEAGHPAAIARATGYFSKSIQQTLNEMEESGQILSFRQGREKNFRIRPPDWRFLIAPALRDPEENAFPRWVDWMPLFAATVVFLEALAKPGLDEKSERFQAIQLRAALDQAMPALVRAGVAPKLMTSRDLRGADLVRSLLADLDTLLD